MDEGDGEGDVNGVLEGDGVGNVVCDVEGVTETAGRVNLVLKCVTESFLWIDGKGLVRLEVFSVVCLLVVVAS